MSMSSSSITRMHLHTLMMNYVSEDIEIRKNKVLDFLKEHFNTNGDAVATNALVTFVRNQFFSPYLKRWKDANRNKERFFAKNSSWLEQEILFPQEVLRCLPCSSREDTLKIGRPSKEFSDCSEVIKRRKTSELREKRSSDELSFATAMKLREEGEISAAKLLVEATTTTPTRASKILNRWRCKDSTQTRCSDEEALALLVSLNFSKRQYCAIRQIAVNHGHDLFPPFYKITNLKNTFYPQNLAVSETECIVPLQDLLNQTCQSILKCISIEADTELQTKDLTLLCKWGFDGSSSYSSYKHTHSESSASTAPQAEESLFATSLVPLHLIDNNSKKMLWKNPRPSSKRFCRPLRLQWIKETEEVIKQVESSVKKEIDSLEVYSSPIGQINFDLLLTMVDGKVCSALTSTSSMTCYICKAKISEMNNIVSLRERPIDSTTLQLGLSVLHAYIRFFECLLHISYRLELKTWKVTKDKQGNFKERKQKIQAEFKNKMGLLVDVPKSGSGTTNDGNTARRFFKNPALASEITGVDEELIKRFGIILRTLNSGLDINIDSFEIFCLETAEKFVQLYGWYYMPPSVHKILIHGPTVIRNSIVPIGQLSEEAQESKNKDIRRYRADHTRKMCLKKVNTDLFNRLLLSSDPYLSSLDINTSKPKISKSDKDILPFVICDDISDSEIELDEVEDDEDDECD